MLNIKTDHCLYEWLIFLQVVKKKGCARLQMSVLEWNTKAKNLYTSKGAQDLTVSEGWHAMRFEGQHLDNLAGEAPKEWPKIIHIEFSEITLSSPLKSFFVKFKMYLKSLLHLFEVEYLHRTDLSWKCQVIKCFSSFYGFKMYLIQPVFWLFWTDLTWKFLL